jgi:hypothetical protein
MSMEMMNASYFIIKIGQKYSKVDEMGNRGIPMEELIEKEK